MPPITVGTILRLAHIIISANSPILQIPIIDSAYYHHWALRIAGGEIIGKAVFFMSPLYSYLMSPFYTIFGGHPIVTALLQAVLSGFTLWFIFRIGERVGGKLVGSIAAWAGAIFPVWIYFDGLLLTSSLILFLNTAALWNILLWLDSKRDRHIFRAGILFGLSALARPSALLLALAFAGWTWFKWKREYAVILLIATAIVVFPVTLRNIAVSGEPALITASAGMNFYVGNSQYATGLYAEPDFLRSSEPEFEAEDYRNEAQSRTMKIKSLSGTSRYWFGQGLKYLLLHPIRAVTLWWNKFFYFWNDLEAPNNLSYYAVKRYSPVVRIIPLGFGILTALGVTGLIFAGRSKQRTALGIYILCVLAVNMIFFTSSEFRFPVISALLVGVGLFGKKVVEWVRERNLSGTAIAALVAMLFFTHYQTNMATVLKSPRMDYFNLGSVSLENGKYLEAVYFFTESLREDPAFIEAHMGLGTALLELEEYEMAALEFRAAGYNVTAEMLKKQMDLEKGEAGNAKAPADNGAHSP